MGYPSICMQALYTFYISALNMILAGFGDEAVTVLGLYCKLQAFFFIPFLGLQACIVPVISYNFGIKDLSRCRKVFSASVLVSVIMEFVAMAVFFKP
ncbi:MATE family efflux transporter [Ruminococcus sp.]|uniref:MATE family efflux transporter n=1 Tax=Ruminococcus sp. TaxID=41978 RepID=UPI0025CD5C96|nr:MATE family efflux transporter [Ruminococcus sp.]